jgi:cytochrome c oxidase subunit II
MILQARLPSTWIGHESVMRPSSSAAHSVFGLFTFMMVVSVTVYVLVIIAALFAVRRAQKSARPESGDDDPGLRRAVTGATIATVVILFAYLFYDFGVGRAVAAPFGAPNVLHISVVGHQWWWEVQYNDTAPQRRLTTANEIHVPVNRPVLFSLSSTDVIHSFWVPNLNGKRDLIPGHQNDAWFQADTAGVYRGQCAEFCGLQHAKMALVIVAESPAQYAAWYNAQLKSAATPTDPVRLAGQKVFLAGSCAMCHAIGGTSAGATFGPDLTHVGSRLTLAAGVLPNTPGNLSGWIIDPQGVKPGANMPPNNIPPRDLRALVSYLQGLK